MGVKRGARSQDAGVLHPSALRVTQAHRFSLGSASSSAGRVIPRAWRLTQEEAGRVCYHEPRV